MPAAGDRPRRAARAARAGARRRRALTTGRRAEGLGDVHRRRSSPRPCGVVAADDLYDALTPPVLRACASSVRSRHGRRGAAPRTLDADVRGSPTRPPSGAWRSCRGPRASAADERVARRGSTFAGERGPRGVAAVMARGRARRAVLVVRTRTTGARSSLVQVVSFVRRLHGATLTPARTASDVGGGSAAGCERRPSARASARSPTRTRSSPRRSRGRPRRRAPPRPCHRP